MTVPPTFEIHMDHPAKNSLGEPLIEFLETQLDAAGDRPLLLTGTEGAFCAGLDLKHLASLDAAGMETYLRRVDALAARLFDHPAPTVAAVTGHAIAGGCVLAVACDHRVARNSERLRLGLNEVALGVCFPPAILGLLRNRLPAQHIQRVLLGAELFAPTAALTLGLVDEVADDALQVGRERLAALAQRPARAYAQTKRVLHAGAATVDAEVERRFLEEELPVWTSNEVKERVLAVLKR